MFFFSDSVVKMPKLPGQSKAGRKKAQDNVNSNIPFKIIPFHTSDPGIADP